MKVCNKCKENKPLDQFWNSKAVNSGKCARCIDCMSEYAKTYKKKNRKKMNEYLKKWHKENPGKHREYYLNYRKNDNFKELHKKRNDRYRKRKPHINRAKWTRYYTKKIKACPSWVNQEQLKIIYENCPEGYEVDHIIPLQGESVSGLHVPWNLQYLTRSENASKSNKVENYG